MTRYRKKPVEVEAWLYDWRLCGMPLWVVDAINSGTIIIDDSWGAVIKTLEGDMHAEDGDYIIRGVKGELYPCKPDIFEATYERCEA